MFKRVLLPVLATCLSLAAPAAAQDKTIYSSLPLSGDARPQSVDVVNAMRMALDESGRTDIRYVSLNDAIASTGKWEPGQVAKNARRAASDASAVAYLGEFNSGGTAVSLPILNEAGIMQISPSNTYAGLTRGGWFRGEPGIYNPSGRRTYARVIPADHTQAHAVLAFARERGKKRLALVHDGESYGRGMARAVRAAAAEYGIATVTFVRHGRNARAIGRLIRRRKADAMFYGGITQNRAAALWRGVHARNRKIDLYGPDGVAEEPFTRRIPSTSRSRTFITDPTLHPFAYPQAGKDFFNRFANRYGKNPEPYAIYGYEAMALALDALARGGNTRAGAIEALFATRDRQSILGTYSIDGNGDTTLLDYGLYRVGSRGRLAFFKVVVARP